MDTKYILFDCLIKYCGNMSEGNFFENWFTNNGKSFSFIFKQNLFVTNIQFRELLDLIQLNVYKDKRRCNINFMRKRDFDNLINGIIESFIDEKEMLNLDKGMPQNIYERLEMICDNYIQLFENTIIIDAFYTSCIVSVPNCLELDLMEICYQSGYIHSCGENVYTRNIQKAKYDSFVEKLENYFLHYNSCLDFIMYTHEEYPIKNKIYINNFEKNGLDEIKFYQQKYYMQDMSLFEVAARLNEDKRLKGKISVTSKRDIKNKNNNECIWLIIDRSIGKDLKYPGDKKYYICYKQIYINENPFHIFDEDKPGWINHVTIPHTLAGAMLNIGRSGCINTEQKYQVIDPFVGSGTTFLESLKYSDVEFHGGDISRISQDSSILNLEFFSQDISELENIADFILVYIKYISSEKCNIILKDLNLEEKRVSLDENRNIVVAFQFALISIEEKFKVDEKTFSEEFNNIIAELEKNVSSCVKYEKKEAVRKKKKIVNRKNLKLICKIWALVTWKTYKRNEYLFNSNRNLKLIDESFEEFKALYYRIVSFINLRKRCETAFENSRVEERLITYFGKYTKGCSVNYKFLLQESKRNIVRIQSNIDVIDFLHQYEKTKVDLIITDPPYGFNTVEEKEKFSKWYACCWFFRVLAKGN